MLSIQDSNEPGATSLVIEVRELSLCTIWTHFCFVIMNSHEATLGLSEWRRCVIDRSLAGFLKFDLMRRQNCVDWTEEGLLAASDLHSRKLGSYVMRVTLE